MNLEEAQSTYESLICDYSNLSDGDQVNAIEDFLINKGSINEIHVSLGEFKNAFKNCFLTHTSSYDPLDEETLSRLKKGTIILATDPENGRSVVIDGNRRLNSYLNDYPEEIITVVEISAPVPESICTYKF